ncbi:hypothetical protein C5B91_15985 [Haloferax sp. Atlit-10N]|uniref:hypothetical protein n=1 Tax=unclassified Haloferax TaxID=2625095 RepID=UPI000E266BE9|nr:MULTISPECIES: hypothetical protein [unclassified Haloferax]RDZ42345.1 hypothetical protein C5B86_16550 [Haloferax sp. Atlit-19N]RDZ42629.1 hypothetical protein C5B87_16815 [Haloferax sp. Atlit-16N]RDZ57501.1 hypothetical protein C5B91_15985 [Haloferax sp. Atlit-10N]
MEIPSNTLKRASIALLVALLMTTAGCSSFAGGDAGDTTAANETAETTETTASDVEGTANDTASSNDATAAETTAADATNESSDSDSDNHSHSHDSAANTSNESSVDAAYTGQMAVMVAGERVSLTEDLDEDAPVHMTDVDSWHTNESTTLAEALEAADVNATESSLTYDGETYEESNNGTKLIYRVDSHEVDPESYTLESDDKVWVLVVSDDSNVTTPGEYIPPEQLHVHGTIDFTVDGERLDFSRDKYQQAGHNDHFHFEGGHANPWHAHSAHVTLAYGMSTLDGINMTDEGVTYNGTTYAYDGDGDNATANVTVNGESVDPTDYYLKNGDSVSIEIASSD